jgi:hypothetical protein
MSQPEYQPAWPESEQQLITLGGDAEFDADMAYLRGMASALFEFATPAHIAKIAEDAGIS